jgi:uncharacterized protein YjbI with pentapeptide repeats
MRCADLAGAQFRGADLRGSKLHAASVDYLQVRRT